MYLGVKSIISIDLLCQKTPIALVRTLKWPLLGKTIISPNFPTVENGCGCIVRTLFLGVKIMIAIDFSSQITPISLVRALKTANIKENPIITKFSHGRKWAWPYCTNLVSRCQNHDCYRFFESKNPHFTC